MSHIFQREIRSSKISGENQISSWHLSLSLRECNGFFLNPQVLQIQLVESNIKQESSGNLISFRLLKLDVQIWDVIFIISDLQLLSE